NGPSGRLNRVGSLQARRGYSSGGVIDDVLQFFTGLEIGNLFGGNFHARAGLWVPSYTRLPLPRPETAESADLNLIAAAQGTNDAVEDRLHYHFSLFPGHFNHSGDFFNQVRFRHVSPFS